MVRREFMESMVDRAATGKTVFLSSHQLNEVERVADYVALIKDGNLLFTESLNELKENISELSIAVSEAGVPLPKLPGAIIHCEKRDDNGESLPRTLATMPFRKSNRKSLSNIARSNDQRWRKFLSVTFLKTSLDSQTEIGNLTQGKIPKPPIRRRKLFLAVEPSGKPSLKR